MNNQVVKCDACQAQIAVSQKIIKNRLSDGVLFTFFQCPHCEAAFLISASDEDFRKQLRRRANGMKRNKKLQYMDSEDVRRLSREQVEKYRPRFKELVPTAWAGFQNTEVEPE